MNLLLMGRRRGGVKYSQRVLSLSPLAYWPLWDLTGTAATELVHGWNGSIVGGVSLGWPGLEGRTCALFDGSTGYVNCHSAGLAAAFTGASFTIMGMFSVASEDVWTDGTDRRMIYVYVDTSNRAGFVKNTADNTVTMLAIAGGTSKTKALTLSGTDLMHFAIRRSEADGLVHFFLNGVQQGEAFGTIGTWSGAPGVITIGAGSTAPTNLWSGLGHMVSIHCPALPVSTIQALGAYAAARV